MSGNPAIKKSEAAASKRRKANAVGALRQQQLTADTARYAPHGFTDDITVCENCGKEDLKGTVRLAILDADGNEDGQLYAGVTCAAKLAGRTAREIRTEARQADKQRAAAAARAQTVADRAAHYRTKPAAELREIHARMMRAPAGHCYRAMAEEVAAVLAERGETTD